MEIRFNLMPAVVTVYDAEDNELETYPKTRVVVSTDTIYAFIDSNTGPVQAFSYRLDDFSGSAREGWTAATSEEVTVRFHRSSGCSCGSRLKGFDPFPGAAFIGM